MIALMLYSWLLSFASASSSPHSWKGVDETVVEHHARMAGVLPPPEAEAADEDSGDLLLFYFLCAGALGGFIAGYSFHALFKPQP